MSLASEANNFYVHFEAIFSQQAKAAQAEVNGWVGAPFTLSEHDIKRAFKHVNTKKAAGPHGISGQVLKLCADQLATVFTMKPAQSVIPMCFKKSTIIPVSKKTKPACLNDYCREVCSDQVL